MQSAGLAIARPSSIVANLITGKMGGATQSSNLTYSTLMSWDKSSSPELNLCTLENITRWCSIFLVFLFIFCSEKCILPCFIKKQVDFRSMKCRIKKIPKNKCYLSCFDAIYKLQIAYGLVDSGPHYLPFTDSITVIYMD